MTLSPILIKRYALNEASLYPSFLGVTMRIRQIMIQFHMLVAAFFMPLMLLMPLSGGLYLWGEKGSQDKEEVFIINEPVPAEESQMKLFFEGQFVKNQIEYGFDYIKVNGSDYIFRPTNKTHYVASLENNTLKMYKVNPSWVKRIIEMHKGHGPKWLRNFAMIFALALLLVSISGVILGFLIPKYRWSVTLAMVGGAVVIALAFI